MSTPRVPHAQFARTTTTLAASMVRSNSRRLPVALIAAVFLFSVISPAPAADAATRVGVWFTQPRAGATIGINQRITVRWAINGIRQSGAATLTRLRAPAVSATRCPAASSTKWRVVGRTAVRARYVLVSSLRPGMCFRWKVAIRTPSGRVYRALSGAAMTHGSSFTPAPSPGGAVYGSAVAMDSLANTQVGGTACGCAGSRTSYRFRAVTSSTLTSVRVYIQGGDGYSGGNGGRLQLTLQTDDGTASHLPSGTVLATQSIVPGNPISIGNLPLVRFSSPASLRAGHLYHLVFRNTDGSPRTNFVSVNAVFTYKKLSPRQPGLTDLEWAQLLNTGSGWSVRSSYTPILGLTYGNGVTDGVGYMESWVRAPKSISGSESMRQILIPTADRSVASIAVRLNRVSGASPLTVRLETSGGDVIQQGQIPASLIAIGAPLIEGGSTWAAYPFPSATTLRAGQRYHLVLSAPADTVYSTFAVRKGAGYGFAASTYFADGYGQYNSGSGWLNIEAPWGGSGGQGDLQFYFR